MSKVINKEDMPVMTMQDIATWYENNSSVYVQYKPNQLRYELWENGIYGGIYDDYELQEDGSYKYKWSVDCGNPIQVDP